MICANQVTAKRLAKVKALAMKSVFSAKVQDNELRVLNQLVMDVPKTKEMIAVLNNINAQKALVITSGETTETIIRSANNIPSSDNDS